MNVKEKINCPSCGRPNRQGKKFCTTCGSSMSGHDSGKRYTLKWILVSMLLIALQQLLLLIIAFLLIYFISGRDAFLENLIFTGKLVIPLAVFLGSFICAFFIRQCTVTDIVFGMVVYFCLLTTINILIGGSVNLSYFIFLIEITLLAFTGSWIAKKLRAGYKKTA